MKLAIIAALALASFAAGTGAVASYKFGYVVADSGMEIKSALVDPSLAVPALDADGVVVPDTFTLAASFDDAADGDYVAYAVAVDADGNEIGSRMSAPAVVVTPPPAPPDSIQLLVPTSITVTVSAPAASTA